MSWKFSKTFYYNNLPNNAFIKGHFGQLNITFKSSTKEVSSSKNLKTKAALSGKKWDSASKNLAKHGLIKVSLVGENKVVDLV